MNISQKIVFDIKKVNNLRNSLKDLNFDFFDHKHAFWRSKKGQITIIPFHNGTLLLQGDKEAIKDLLPVLPIVNLVQNRVEEIPTINILGLDESGKGDYFGPLVLAGAVVKPDTYDLLQRLGVMDSKKMTDTTICQIYPELIKYVIYQVRVITPSEYNTSYKIHRNLNLLMIEEYIHLISVFNFDKYDKIILDKFSNSENQNHFIKKSISKEIIIVEKAEEYIPVAAASIIARYHFINWLGQTSEKFGIKFLKGSGKDVARLFTRLKNDLKSKEFEEIAKTHFKEQDDSLLFNE